MTVIRATNTTYEVSFGESATQPTIGEQELAALLPWLMPDAFGAGGQGQALGGDPMMDLLMQGFAFDPALAAEFEQNRQGLHQGEGCCPTQQGTGNPMLDQLMRLNPIDLLQMMVMFALMNRLSQGQDLGNLQNGGWDGSRSVAPEAFAGTPSGSPSANADGAARIPENMPTGEGTSGDFLAAAMAQDGDRYVYGAETRLDDANPHTFDCSELVQWAAAQAGVEIPDGSANQRNWVRQHGTELSVEEALRTPGALLFRDGHVAISLGDGRTIEAKGSKYGVGVFNGEGRFTSGGLVPGMNYAPPAPQQNVPSNVV